MVTYSSVIYFSIREGRSLLDPSPFNKNSGKVDFLLIPDFSRYSGHLEISRLRTIVANSLRPKTEIASCLLIRTVKKISRATFPLPTVFPLLIDKIGFIVLIIITKSVSRFANLLKSLTAIYPLLISRSQVRSLHGSPIYNLASLVIRDLC